MLDAAGLPVPDNDGVPLRLAPDSRVRVADYPKAMPVGMSKVQAAHPDFDRTPFDRALRAVYTDDVKLIAASDGRHELYRRSDRHEAHDLAGTPALDEALAAVRHHLPDESDDDAPVAVLTERETLELKALGYLH